MEASVGLDLLVLFYQEKSTITSFYQEKSTVKKGESSEHPLHLIATTSHLEVFFIYPLWDMLKSMLPIPFCLAIIHTLGNKRKVIPINAIIKVV